MRAVAICAVLIASALDRIPAAAPTDLGEGEEAPAEVMPWSSRTGISGFGFQPDTGAATDYQWSLSQSLTVQANRYLWLHGGYRAVETEAPGFSQPYREWGSVQIGAVAQVFPDLLYFLAAGNYVLGHTTLPLSDSVPLSQILNGYSPLPDPGFLSAPSGLLGLLLRLPILAGDALLGANYDRLGRVDPFDTLAFTPASCFSLSAQYHFQNEGVEHAARARLFLFTGEITADAIVAHQEGPLLEAEYAVDGAGADHGWDAGLGLAYKWIDDNRRVRLNVAPEEAAGNDNLQRVWLDLRWRPWRQRTRLWTGVRGQLLYQEDTQDLGYEARWECGWERLLEGEHPVEFQLHLLYAAIAGVTYRGAGLSMDFAFRHLGAQPAPGIPSQ